MGLEGVLETQVPTRDITTVGYVGVIVAISVDNVSSGTLGQVVVSAQSPGFLIGSTSVNRTILSLQHDRAHGVGNVNQPRIASAFDVFVNETDFGVAEGVTNANFPSGISSRRGSVGILIGQGDEQRAIGVDAGSGNRVDGVGGIQRATSFAVAHHHGDSSMEATDGRGDVGQSLT